MSDATNFGGSSRPQTPEGAKAFVVTPFARLARTHGVSAMADAMVAASLAGSLFFSMPAGDARSPVLRYLVITMLPFAVLSPLIGPMIDRLKGGHRLMVIASAVLRSFACWFMATEVRSGNFTFFLYALCLLVFQKAYQVGRSALVPTVVRNDTELVQANSKLALISGIASFVGVVPAGILLKLFGAEWSLRLAMITYVVAAVLGTRIKSVRVAEESADQTEKLELRGATIIMAGSAMGLIRGCVGFLTLLVAFDFRGGGRPTWQFGLVGGASVLSQLVGAAAGPRIRQMTSEENLLTGVLGLVCFGGLAALVLGDVMGATVLGACVGFAAGGGKLAFDSILQRDAPDANRGRAFARFETRFQVTWVIGALIPVAVAVSVTAGFLIVFTVALVALASYLLARLSYAHQTGARQTIATARAAEIEGKMNVVSSEVKGRLARAPRAAFRRLRTTRDDGDGEYAEGEYAEGEYAEGEYDEAGNWVPYADGEYAEGEYDEAGNWVPFADGEYAEGEYVEGEYDEAGNWVPYADGEYAEGEYVEGEYDGATEVVDDGDPATEVVADEPADADDADDELTGDDPSRWAQPQWADGAVAPHEPTEVDPEPTQAAPLRRGRRRGRPTPEPAPAPEPPAAPQRPARHDRSEALAASSPVAWVPDDEDDEDEFPWEAPVADSFDEGYLADVDPSVANPFPWSPDDATRPDR